MNGAMRFVIEDGELNAASPFTYGPDVTPEDVEWMWSAVGESYRIEFDPEDSGRIIRIERP